MEGGAYYGTSRGASVSIPVGTVMYIAAIFVAMFAGNLKQNSLIKWRLWHVLVLVVMRKIRERKQTDPCGKDKKEKQHKLPEINIHFGLKHKR